MVFPNKLVAILNKDIDTGVAMNAVAHMTIGLGAKLGAPALLFDDYYNQEGHIYPNISRIPFIILRGKSTEIKRVIHTARNHNIHFSAFTNTMTNGTYQEQLDRTAETAEESLIYYGCALFGDWEEVSQITKRFSLYKS